MARRNSYPGGKWNQKPGQAYSRTSGWPTRYYQRKITGSMVSALAGLNTTADDFEKKEGETSYLWNARLNGSKEDRKRAQSMSRMGQKFYAIPDGAESTNIVAKGDVYVTVSETKSVKWNLFSDVRITCAGLRFAFDTAPGDTNAHFVLILRDSNKKEICRAIRKVTEIYNSNEEIQWFRFIRTLSGNVTLEATIVDDFDNNGIPVGIEVKINATGAENHWFSEHKLPNLDKNLREAPYVWQRGINLPVTCTKTCDWGTFPTWLQRGYFNAGGYRYSIMGVIDGSGNKKIYKVKYGAFDSDKSELTTYETPEISLLIDSNWINQGATQVRMAQAGNCLYFVDGYSNLRKVDLDTWTVSDSVPDSSDIDTFGYCSNMYYYANSVIVDGQHFWRCNEDHQGGESFDSTEQAYWSQENLDSLTAWPGASLIYFHNNRLVLSGFRHATVGTTNPKAEPNLVILSSITSVKPEYDIWNKSIEFFYVPDMAQSQSSAAPVTGFSHIGDYLLIHTTDGLVIEEIASAVEFAGIEQTVPEGSQYGVMRQEHICEGRNNVYFYNPTMGIIRTAGSTATIVSSPVDSIFAGISEKAKATAHLCMTNDLLRFYYDSESDDNVNSNNTALVDYYGTSQHRSYWYRDQNTPVASTCIDLSSEIYMATHSEYPAMFLLDWTLKDFDCAILYEYYTKYIGTPDRLDSVIVRRLHITTLQTFQSSIYVGVDYDHNNKPIVWRKFITPTVKGTFEAEDIFNDDDETGAFNIDIRLLTTDTKFVQIRLKQYCYDFQAEILQVGFEYANRTTL